MVCSNCNGTRIETGVVIGLTDIGPKYRNGPFTQFSQMYSDICLDCGEILRFYIKESTDKNWVKTP